MPVRTVTLFFALLALIALVGAFVLALSRRSRLIDKFVPHAYSLSWLVALVATGGSLYLSEAAGFIPCSLCWVQRGFMYPMAVVLAVFLFKPPASLPQWAIGWPLAGAAVAGYHIGVQHLTPIFGNSFCTATAPCTTLWVNHFGFVTIPFMALAGFLAIAALLWIRARSERRTERRADEHIPST
jgi:disulfide bond formation protein DsbB